MLKSLVVGLFQATGRRGKVTLLAKPLLLSEFVGFAAVFQIIVSHLFI